MARKKEKMELWFSLKNKLLLKKQKQKTKPCSKLGLKPYIVLYFGRNRVYSGRTTEALNVNKSPFTS